MSSNPNRNPILNPRLDTADLAAAVVLADGNLHLVAEQYHSTPEAVLNALSSDATAHELMARQFRTRALIRQFEVMGSITDTLASKVTEMRADHLVQSFKAMASSFATLSASGQVAGPNSTTTNVNVFERVMQLMPPHVREAMLVAQSISPDDPELQEIIDQIEQSPALSPNNMASSTDTSTSAAGSPVQAEVPSLPSAPSSEREQILKLLR